MSKPHFIEKSFVNFQVSLFHVLFCVSQMMQLLGLFNVKTISNEKIEFYTSDFLFFNILPVYYH